MDDPQMRVLGPGEQDRILSFPAAIGAQCPPDDRVPAKERLPETLLIPIPQLLSRNGSSDCPLRHSCHDHRQGIVQPYHCISSAPDNVANHAVVAIRALGTPTKGSRNTLAKDLAWSGGPVRSPMEGIQFDMLDAQSLCQSVRQCRLARSADANHGNALRPFLVFASKHSS
jgi:hypothetical protein